MHLKRCVVSGFLTTLTEAIDHHHDEAKTVRDDSSRSALFAGSFSKPVLSLHRFRKK